MPVGSGGRLPVAPGSRLLIPGGFVPGGDGEDGYASLNPSFSCFRSTVRIISTLS